MLLEDVIISGTWIYVLALHNTYCMFFDYDDPNDAPLLEMCSFIHGASIQVLNDLIFYKKPPHNAEQFVLEKCERSCQRVTAILSLAALHDDCLQSILSNCEAL